VVHYASKATTFQSTLHRLTTSIVISGIAICGCFEVVRVWYPAAGGTTPGGEKKKKKEPLGMLESARFLAGSPYLRLLATLVVSYGLTINFTEIIWKSLVKKQYPDALEYSRFMGSFSSAVGGATFFVIFIGGNIIKHLGWRVGALTTPAIMTVLAVPFFTCILMGIGTDKMLTLAVALGTVQVSAPRATKGCGGANKSG